MFSSEPAETGEREADAAALGIMRDIYPDREIATVRTRDILYGGGNIHCITQQEPLPLAR